MASPARAWSGEPYRYQQIDDGREESKVEGKKWVYTIPASSPVPSPNRNLVAPIPRRPVGGMLPPSQIARQNHERAALEVIRQYNEGRLQPNEDAVAQAKLFAKQFREVMAKQKEEIAAKIENSKVRIGELENKISTQLQLLIQLEQEENEKIQMRISRVDEICRETIERVPSSWPYVARQRQACVQEITEGLRDQTREFQENIRTEQFILHLEQINLLELEASLERIK